MEIFFFAIFLSGVVHFLTASVLGRKKANYLPGGAIMVTSMLSPFWLSALGGLVGQIIVAKIINYLDIFGCPWSFFKKTS